MRIPFGSILGCCVAALPLIGCVGGYAPMPPQAGSPPAAAIPEQGRVRRRRDRGSGTLGRSGLRRRTAALAMGRSPDC